MHKENILIQKNLKLIKEEITSLQQELKEINSNYYAQYEVFKKKKNIKGSSGLEEKFSISLRLDQIPAFSVLKKIKGKDNMIDNANIKGLLEENYKAMLDVLEMTNTFYLIEPIGVIDNNYFNAKINIEIPHKDKKEVRFFYRSVNNFYLHKFKAVNVDATGDDAPRIVYVEDTLPEHLLLVHPNANVNYLTFKASNWTKRELTLNFDEGTNALIKVEGKSGSTGQAVAKAVEDTVSSALTDYSAGLETVKKIQSSIRTIKQHDLLSKIETLKNKKELVDKRVSFEGANATKELLVQKKVLDEQLSNLNSKLALETAQSTYDLDLRNALINSEHSLMAKDFELQKLQATFEQKIEIEKLKTLTDLLTNRLKAESKEENYDRELEIAILQSEIEHLKARLAHEQQNN